MTDHDKNQLLEDLFGDGELDQLRQASLKRGLQAMRGQRRRTVAVRLAVMSLPVLLLAFTVFYPRLQPREQVSATNIPARSSAPESKVEYITKEQLFALFPDRQMALVGKPGHQQLIFLDNPPAGETQ